MSRIRSLVAGLIWVALAVVIAAGIAGVAATMNRAPGTPAREELTWVGDRESEPALDAATVKLQALADRVDELSETARDALVHVTSGDLDALQQAIANGTLQLDAVDAATTDLRVSLVSVPHAGRDWALEVSEGQHPLRRAGQTTAPHCRARRRLGGRSPVGPSTPRPCTRCSRGTTRRRRGRGAEGTPGGTRARSRLDASDATIRQTNAARDRLATTSTSRRSPPGSTAADYDAALRQLYEASSTSTGR